MKKMVIILRTDLNMRKGKMVSQGCHGAVNAIIQQGTFVYYNQVPGLFIPFTPDLIEWFNGEDWNSELFDGLYTKITVGVNSEDELLEICRQAEVAKLNSKLIMDAGKTEFHGLPTITGFVIGPADAEEIDKITSHLKLL